MEELRLRKTLSGLLLDTVLLQPKGHVQQEDIGALVDTLEYLWRRSVISKLALQRPSNFQRLLVVWSILGGHERCSSEVPEP